MSLGREADAAAVNREKQGGKHQRLAPACNPTSEEGHSRTLIKPDLSKYVDLPSMFEMSVHVCRRDSSEEAFQSNCPSLSRDVTD